MKATAAIYYRTMTGNTHKVALRIADLFHDTVTGCYEISKHGFLDWEKHHILIFGTPTWDIGMLPDGWDLLDTILKNPLLKYKKIALFGLGDQGSYPDSFADGLGILYHLFREAGCTIYGRWPVSGYSFAYSRAAEHNYFPGLVVDNNQQANLTDERIRQWVKQIKKEFHLDGNESK